MQIISFGLGYVGIFFQVGFLKILYFKHLAIVVYLNVKVCWNLDYALNRNLSDSIDEDFLDHLFLNYFLYFNYPLYKHLYYFLDEYLFFNDLLNYPFDLYNFL